MIFRVHDVGRAFGLADDGAVVAQPIQAEGVETEVLKIEVASKVGARLGIARAGGLGHEFFVLDDVPLGLVVREESVGDVDHGDRVGVIVCGNVAHRVGPFVLGVQFVADEAEDFPRRGDLTAETDVILQKRHRSRIPRLDVREKIVEELAGFDVPLLVAQVYRVENHGARVLLPHCQVSDIAEDGAFEVGRGASLAQLAGGCGQDGRLGASTRARSEDPFFGEARAHEAGHQADSVDYLGVLVR